MTGPLIFGLNVPGAVALRGLSSATTLLATLATPANGGVLPTPLARKGLILEDKVQDTSWIDMLVEDSILPTVNESAFELASSDQKYPCETLLEQWNKDKARTLYYVEHRSLVTACILSLWRAYGHDAGVPSARTRAF